MLIASTNDLYFHVILTDAPLPESLLFLWEITHLGLPGLKGGALRGKWARITRDDETLEFSNENGHIWG